MPLRLVDQLSGAFATMMRGIASLGGSAETATEALDRMRVRLAEVERQANEMLARVENAPMTMIVGGANAPGEPGVVFRYERLDLTAPVDGLLQARVTIPLSGPPWRPAGRVHLIPLEGVPGPEYWVEVSEWSLHRDRNETHGGVGVRRTVMELSGYVCDDAQGEGQVSISPSDSYSPSGEDDDDPYWEDDHEPQSELQPLPNPGTARRRIRFS